MQPGKFDKQTTCFKSENLSCIDLILINKKELFKHSEFTQLGISSRHSFDVTSLKSQLLKGNTKTKIYRDYSEFNIGALRENLDKSLSGRNACLYKHFQNTFVQTLNRHAPFKTKYLVSTKIFSWQRHWLRKTIKHRSKLKSVINPGQMKTLLAVKSKGIFV